MNYTYHPDSNHLSIEGSGSMYYYDIDNFPWSQFRLNVKTIDIWLYVNTISDYAFYNFENLEIVTAYYLTKYGKYSFCGCKKLTSISMSDCIQNIPDGCFCNCCSLTSFILPETVISIGSYAFYNCNLSSLVFMGNVSIINSFSFYKINEAALIHYLGKNEPTIYYNAFSSNMTNPVYVTKGYQSNLFGSLNIFVYYDSGTLNSNKWLYNLYTNDMYIYGNSYIPSYESKEQAPWWKYHDEIYSVIFGKYVETVGNNAFTSYPNLHSIKFLGSRVRYIGDNAFANCSNLTGTIELSDGLKKIRPYAFSQTRILTIIFTGWDLPECDNTSFIDSNGNIPDTLCAYVLSRNSHQPFCNLNTFLFDESYTPSDTHDYQIFDKYFTTIILPLNANEDELNEAILDKNVTLQNYYEKGRPLRH